MNAHLQRTAQYRWQELINGLQHQRYRGSVSICYVFFDKTLCTFSVNVLACSSIYSCYQIVSSLSLAGSRGSAKLCILCTFILFSVCYLWIQSCLIFLMWKTLVLTALQADIVSPSAPLIVYWILDSWTVLVCPTVFIPTIDIQLARELSFKVVWRLWWS